ncbi:hypothetical protein HN748_06395 [Candidatus Peregrinibacteria bacterium]|jgi:hypothetical protein|nr:hypothetical protein [Candidatus Peregrinibacteria bacterium]MBT7484273.1 hypothetical protein [Candidatus Peregrinibacteria bacterium]MBT7703832.1 hypothetical protein [Candidatus Peregrinibacteria bacterium]
MIENFTIEDLATMLAMATTISNKKRDELIERLHEETKESDEKGTNLSKELTQDLVAVLETELHHLENEKIPNAHLLEDDANEEYKHELKAAQPDLIELIDDYERETEKMMKDLKDDYLVLDKELDEYAQAHTAVHEEAEIASIKAKLNPNT